MIDLLIAILGLLSIALALSTSELVRHASAWVALPTQPFWLEYFYMDKKWAFFIVSIALTFVWIHAAIRGWLPLTRWLHAWYMVLLWKVYDVGRSEGQGSSGS